MGIFQHSPINVVVLLDVEHLQETMVVVTGKRFSEQISHVLRGGNPLDGNGPRLYEFPNVMVPDVDMLDLHQQTQISLQITT